MELYILSKEDLSILSVAKIIDYEINLDEETNAKSIFKVIKCEGLKKSNFIVVNGLYKQFLFVIDEVNGEKSSNVAEITALDISNIFDRKVIEKNIDTMSTDSIEEFIANTIYENFVNSDDSVLNVGYIDVYWNTNTQTTVATNAENGLYNFHIFLINCRQYKNIYTEFSFTEDKRLRIDITNKVEETKLVDTTLAEVTDYSKINNDDITAKVTVFIRENNSEYNLYLKTDRTTTTNKNDTNRASGKIEVISVDTADKAAEEALNVMKGNRYKHLVEFKIAKTSKLMDITKLHIGKPIRIKTDDDIYDSYISSITLTDENFVYFKSGSLRTTLIDKLKKKNESIGNKVDVSGGKIKGNLDVDGTLKNKGKSFLDLTYPIGSIYMSIENTNPSSLFGGTWELERTFQGGELLAFGTSYNLNTADTLDNSTGYKAWSEIFTTSNQSITSKNYVDGILIFDSGTFKVNTKGIVGYVEATLILSGNGNENSNSIWFSANKNALPSGIALMGIPKALKTIGYKGAYGGTSNQYYYRVDTTEDLGFYINPNFISYPAGAKFYPGNGGTKCSLNVKVYSSGGTKYMWKRTA